GADVGIRDRTVTGVQTCALPISNAAVVLNENGEGREVELVEVAEGDIVQVRAGDNIPVDGFSTAGRTTVDEALVTGESRNIEKVTDDTVIGGSVNGSGTINVKDRKSVV